MLPTLIQNLGQAYLNLGSFIHVNRVQCALQQMLGHLCAFIQGQIFGLYPPLANLSLR